MQIFIRILILSCISQSIFANVIMPSGINFSSRQLDQYTNLNVLQIDSKKYRIAAYRAKDLGMPVAFVGQFAQHLSAIAVINGGFFRANSLELRSIVPAGVLKINDLWYGIAYKPRGAVGWDPSSGIAIFDRLQTKTKLKINQVTLPVHLMNKLPGSGKAALLNDSYIDQLEVDNAYAVTIENGQVSAVNNSGKLSVPNNGYIYYLKNPSAAQQYNFAVGDRVEYNIHATPQLDTSSISKWQSSPYIVAGGPLLLKNGDIIADNSSEGMGSDFLNAKHARTAIGITRDQNWIMVTISKNYLVGKGGVTIPELAALMHELNCIDALNLDGGGSTAMYVDKILDMSVANPVADVIAVLPKN